MNNKRFTYNFLYNIEVEISSLCNRHCEYCPESKITRKRELIPIEIFEKIMIELKEINYSGGLAFHQFNEPLLEYDHLCECIRCAKRINPSIRLELYTNGDLLTKQRLKELKKLGIDRLVITCHFDNNEKFSKELAYQKVKAMMKKLSIHRRIDVTEDSATMRMSKLLEFVYKLKEFGYGAIKKYPFKLQINSQDYYRTGSSRIGVVQSKERQLVPERNNTYYCYALLHGLHISYKGNVYMCCDCCEGTEAALQYKIGSVYEKPVYDLFAEKIKLMNDYMVDNSVSICHGCFWNQ